MPAWKIVLFVILGILAAFLAITLIRAAFFVPKNERTSRFLTRKSTMTV